MQPPDANSNGFVHGGSIMKLVDTIAGVAAIRHAQSRVVTAQVDSLSFLAPVHIGDVVTFEAVVTQAWHTSMEVKVVVHREDALRGERTLTTTAYLTMVAVDQDGHPVEIPSLEPSTDRERERQAAAEVRREERIHLRERLGT
ncbi:MAG: acyl-CoA thioesterase [Actinobacteria bacterium]|nr:acyl-CoA thioesterase [Actinomycetota bacterium]